MKTYIMTFTSEEMSALREAAHLLKMSFIAKKADGKFSVLDEEQLKLACGLYNEIHYELYPAN